MQFTPETLPDCPPEFDGSFPSHLLPPERKDKAWHLAYVRGMYYQCKNNLGYFSNDRKYDWVDARLYADGNQPVEKYHKWSSRLTDGAGNVVSYMDLNWKIVSPLPKFCAVLKGYFSKLQYKIQATSINPEASDDKNKIKESIWASKTLKPFFAELEQIAQQSFGENPILPFVPDTKEELEMFFKMSYRDQAEMAMEMGLRQVFYENDWDTMSDELWDDVIRLGALGTCTYVDRISKKIKMRYCDPVNMILDTFRGHDGESMERIGEFRLMTIQQLKLAAGDQFTEAEYYDMAYRHRGQYGNQNNLVPYADYVNTDSLYTYNQWDNYQILVLEFFTDSCDRILREKKPVKGVNYYFKKPFDTPMGKKQVTDEAGKMLYEKEVFATDTKTVYGGIWIVGTDYIYDWGKTTDISRPKDNRKEVMKPMRFYRCENQSRIELAIPFADSYMLSWLKIQNLKARAIPKGIMIEIGAFENVALDGKIQSARELLELAIQSGIIVYRKNSTIDDENYDTSHPITETKGGMGAEFKELIESMANDLMSMREVMGISQMFDASQQNPKQLVGTAEMAYEGTENALAPLVKGYQWMHKKCAIDVCLKFQILARYMDLEVYEPSIGRGPVQRLKMGKDISSVTYGIELEALPTQEQKQRILEAAKGALQSTNDPTKGGIDWSDYLKIEKWVINGDWKLADAYFVYRVKQSKEELAKQAQDNIKAQGEQNQKLQQEKLQADAQNMQMEIKGKKELSDNQANNDIKVLGFEYDKKKELLGMDHGHDLAVSRGERANAKK